MTGQIEPRGKGKYLIRVFLGRKADGKRDYFSKMVTGTRKEAEAMLATALHDNNRGVAIKPAQRKLGDFLEEWLGSVAKGGLTPKTFAGYRDCLRRYVIPTLGERSLAKLNSMEIQTLYNNMSARGLSARTVEYTNMILKQALAKAIGNRMLTFNACDEVVLPRKKRKEMKVLSPEQVARFLPVARLDRYGALFELAITTGMRPSEYCALKWSDLDLEAKRVSVCRSIDFLPGGGWAYGENKTARSRRTIKLWRNVVQCLIEHKAKQAIEKEAVGENWLNEDLVFTNELGGPVNRANLTKRNFHKILKAAGLPSIRLYDLRHTCATIALAAGVPVKVVSEMLGHASVAITLDIYSHVLPHMQDEAADKMEELVATHSRRLEAESEEWHTIGTPKPN